MFLLLVWSPEKKHTHILLIGLNALSNNYTQHSLWSLFFNIGACSIWQSHLKVTFCPPVCGVTVLECQAERHAVNVEMLLFCSSFWSLEINKRWLNQDVKNVTVCFSRLQDLIRSFDLLSGNEGESVWRVLMFIYAVSCYCAHCNSLWKVWNILSKTNIRLLGKSEWSLNHQRVLWVWEKLVYKLCVWTDGVSDASCGVRGKLSCLLQSQAH